MNGVVYTQRMNIGWGLGDSGEAAYNTSTVIVDELFYLTPGAQNISAVEIGFLALGAGDGNGASVTSNFSLSLSLWQARGHVNLEPASVPLVEPGHTLILFLLVYGLCCSPIPSVVDVWRI